MACLQGTIDTTADHQPMSTMAAVAVVGDTWPYCIRFRGGSSGHHQDCWNTAMMITMIVESKPSKYVHEVQRACTHCMPVSTVCALTCLQCALPSALELPVEVHRPMNGNMTSEFTELDDGDDKNKLGNVHYSPRSEVRPFRLSTTILSTDGHSMATTVQVAIVPHLGATLPKPTYPIS